MKNLFKRIQDTPPEPPKQSVIEQAEQLAEKLTPPETVHTTLAKMQEEVQNLKRDTSTGTYRGAFDFISINAILAEIKPLMIKHKMLLKPNMIDVQNQLITTTNKKGEDSHQCWSNATIEFIWIHTPTGQTDITRFHGQGYNDLDKSFNSLTTSAERYFLLKYFHIISNDDMTIGTNNNEHSSLHPTNLNTYIAQIIKYKEKGHSFEKCINYFNDKLKKDNKTLSKSQEAKLLEIYSFAEKDEG
jgi:hypothetical protein